MGAAGQSEETFSQLQQRRRRVMMYVLQYVVFACECWAEDSVQESGPPTSLIYSVIDVDISRMPIECILDGYRFQVRSMIL